ncbi:MAG: hypothetical protein K2Q22_03895, partial [Cytophagales bacterium]|nr:hypothetical protein [Cytophagales bacterium]
MKFIIFIFTFYIIALAVMPCSDAITCENEKSSIAKSNTNHSHSEDEGDLCTPFCICACCGCNGFVVSVPYFSIVKTRFITPLFITPYSSDFISSYYNSFWQPPKLG